MPAGTRSIVMQTKWQRGILTTENVYVFVDGTFKITDLPFTCLMCVMALVKREDPVGGTKNTSWFSIPVGWALMRDRQFGDYECVFDELFPASCSPKMVMCDFEKALWKCFLPRFGVGPLQGCAFHYAQAITKKLGELGLSPEKPRPRQGGKKKTAQARSKMKNLMTI